MKKIIICFLCAVILVSVLASCGKETDAGTAGTPETTEVPDTAEAPETTEAPFYKSDVETYLIDTKYAKLTYPVKWQDKVSVEINETAQPYRVSFCTETAYGRITLFDVCFGGADENAVLRGSMNFEGESIDVSVTEYSGDLLNYYPADVNPDIYEMIEDLNEVVSGLVYNYGLEIE